MKVLVTGGAGFIGSHLVDELLVRGHRVAIVDDLSSGTTDNVNPAAAFYQADIRDPRALAEVFDRERPDAVSHHAAQTDVRRSMSDPGFDASVNVLGLVNVLQLAVTSGVSKVLFASSSAVYPDPKFVPVDEAHPIRPQSIYGLTKYVGEQYLQLYRDVYGLAFTAFRYGNVYGPRQDPHGEAGVVAIFSAQILTGVQPTLFGDGTKTRDYVYIDDIVAANMLALDGGGNGEVFNLGWGREISDVEVFRAVRDALGGQGEPRYAAKRPGELDRIALDSTRAKTILRWAPRFGFDEGIRQTTEYYRRCRRC